MITALLAIDPGAHTGLALFQNHLLTWAVTCPSAQMWEKIEMALRHEIGRKVIVSELPQIYRASQSKGDPNHLIPLARQCGEAQAIARYVGAEYHDVLPRTWKGQTPKLVCHSRWKPKLGATETPIFQHASEHARDAICLGLWFLHQERMRL